MRYDPEAIVKGLQEKDPAVFEYLYKNFGKMVVGHVRKNSGSEEDAQEILQITMLELWIAVKDGRYQEQGKLGPYIFQLAANSWREELRRRRYQPQAALEDSGAYTMIDESENSLAAALVKDKYLQAIHEGITQMGEPCRSIIELFHLQKVSLQEVAQQMAYDYDNLRKRIFDCRKKLKKMVEEMLRKEALV